MTSAAALGDEQQAAYCSIFRRPTVVGLGGLLFGLKLLIYTTYH